MPRYLDLLRIMVFEVNRHLTSIVKVNTFFLCMIFRIQNTHNSGGKLAIGAIW